MLRWLSLFHSDSPMLKSNRDWGGGGGGVHWIFPEIPTNCPAHYWGKTNEDYMAKPMVLGLSDSYGKTHGMEKPIGVFMAKPIGPKITIFNDGGRHHQNSSHITNPIFWRFFHHICGIQLDKYTGTLGRVGKLTYNTQIWCQNSKIMKIYQKSESLFSISIGLASCPSEFCSNGINVTYYN